MPTFEEKTTVLGYDNAYHLLRRTTYKITKRRIVQFSKMTPLQAVSELFTFKNATNLIPASPLSIPGGKTFIPTFDAPVIEETLAVADGIQDLTWWTYSAYRDPSAQFKITAFLHTLFVADSSAAVFTDFDHKELLRYHAYGSLKELAYRMTFDRRMTVYLNNNINIAGGPNQNYAREFLELFTILKGKQKGTGDYTNYTEHDVQQAARVFSGFTTDADGGHKFNRLNRVDPITNLPIGLANFATHDKGDKTFSSAFGNKTIKGATNVADMKRELQEFIDMIFAHPATAISYATKMYRHFVGAKITPEIQSGVIIPLAANLRANNYNVRIALTKLWISKHFYDDEDSVKHDQVIGSIVKNPLEFFMHTLSLLEMPIPTYKANSPAILGLTNWITYNAAAAGFPIFLPQSVNGYGGYSDAPNYDRNWITTASLRLRYEYSIAQFLKGIGFANSAGYVFKIDLPKFVRDSNHQDGKNFRDPANPDKLVADFMVLLHLEVASGDRFTHFKQILLGAIGVTNWKNEWNAWIANPSVTNGVKPALDRLVTALIKSPESQIL